MELEWAKDKMSFCAEEALINNHKMWHTEVHKWLLWHLLHEVTTITAMKRALVCYFLLFLYISGCINHVLYTLFEFNVKNDVNLV